MMLDSKASTEFWKLYNTLPEAICDQADTQFALFLGNPDHPSVHLKQVGGFWSIRVSRGYVTLARRNVGSIFLVLDRAARRIRPNSEGLRTGRVRDQGVDSSNDQEHGLFMTIEPDRTHIDWCRKKSAGHFQFSGRSDVWGVYQNS